MKNINNLKYISEKVNTFLLIFITYLIADLYFLYGALLPFLVEFLCSDSTEIEKAINNEGVKNSPLLASDDNNV